MPRLKSISDRDVLESLLKNPAFKGKGFASIGVREIAQIVGLSPATLIQRFGSKENLIRSALHHANKELEERFIREIKECELATGDPIKVVVQVLVKLSSNFRCKSDVAIGLDMFKQDILDPELNKIAVEYFALRKKHLIALLKKLNITSQPEMSAKLLDSVWQGTIMLWAINPSRSLHSELDESVSFLLDLLR